MNLPTSITLIARTLLLAVFVLLAGNIKSAHAQEVGDLANTFDPYVPIFTKANVKIAETARLSFTFELLSNAVNYEPLLTTPGTQMHIGFWSGPGNHGSLVRVLDSINFGVAPCVSSAESPNCAVWDEALPHLSNIPPMSRCYRNIGTIAATPG
jgi:hypothetical protein